MIGEPEALMPLRPLIQKALDRAGNVMTIEDLYCYVLAGEVQLWMAPGAIACMFTELVTYPRVKAIRSMYTAGNMKAAMAMIPEMARWALTRGCTRAEFSASPGWIRASGRKFEIETVFCAAELKDLVNG